MWRIDRNQILARFFSLSSRSIHFYMLSGAEGSSQQVQVDHSCLPYNLFQMKHEYSIRRRSDRTTATLKNQLVTITIDATSVRLYIMDRPNRVRP